jgi:hypothetical protein
VNALLGDAGAPPSALARDACAFACALLVYLAAAGGLFFYAAVLQIAILCGVVAGLFASRWELAAVAGAAAVGVGWLLGPPFAGLTLLSRGDLGSAIACVAGAALVAAATQRGASMLRGRVVQVLSIVLVTFVIANFWATGLGLDANTTRVTSWLAQRPIVGMAWNDDTTFAEIYHRMHEGQDYYQAVQSAFHDNAVVPPITSVLDVRPPAQQWIWQVIAPNSAFIFYDMLLLASLAIVAAAVLAGTLVRRQFAVVAAVPVATAFLYVVAGENVTYSETWAAALTLISLAALVYAAAHEKWRAAFIVGAMAALLAGSMREFCLILPVAGMAASWVAPPERRSVQKIAWVGVAGLLGVYYTAHVLAASRLITMEAPQFSPWFRPGLSNLVVAVRYFEPAFGALGWLPYAIAVLGVVGVAVAPRRQVRMLLSVVAGALIIAFALFRNGAYAARDPKLAVTYWGILLVPLLAACMPVAFALVPGMRRYCGEWPPSNEPEPAEEIAEAIADERHEPTHGEGGCAE